VWRSDGKELYYINPDGAMMAAPIKFDGASVEPGVLTPTHSIHFGQIVGKPYIDVDRESTTTRLERSLNRIDLAQAVLLNCL
jgi:hypothetical protein